jgi:hypothetical protein
MSTLKQAKLWKCKTKKKLIKKIKKPSQLGLTQLARDSWNEIEIKEGENLET